MVDAFAGVSAFTESLKPHGIDPEGFVELDLNCRQLLLHQYPNAEIAGDFYDLEWLSWSNEGVRVLTGGPSCVWASKAGRQLGAADSRSQQIRDMALMARHFQSLSSPVP